MEAGPPPPSILYICSFISCGPNNGGISVGFYSNLARKCFTIRTIDLSLLNQSFQCLKWRLFNTYIHIRRSYTSENLKYLPAKVYFYALTPIKEKNRSVVKSLLN